MIKLLSSEDFIARTSKRHILVRNRSIQFKPIKISWDYFIVGDEEIKIWTSSSNYGDHIMKLNILVPHSIICDKRRFDIGIVWNFHNFLSVHFKSEKNVKLVSLNCTENVYESISIQYFPSKSQ